ncbi:hypothetical protein [uncultured Rikenella sp.]|uniref:hypothetical protein n=1 Tax=uncultured Rikenella sp. TaxID=368003 RepID=UPI00261323CD|nr:hypothetical protein [uncultured Rikenella sp.]
MRYLVFIFITLLVGCSDCSSVVGLYADPTPGPEPEAVKYAQVSDSADCYNIRLYDAKGFLLRQASVPTASFSQGITMAGCRIHPDELSQAIRLIPLYGGYEGTPHLLYKTAPETLPKPTQGKLRLERQYCAGAIPRMTIYAVNMETMSVDSLVINYDVVTDASEYGYIAPDEACNEKLTPEEEKEYYEQLAFQNAILYLTPGKYVVYAYTAERHIPMSCHNKTGELAEIEIQTGHTTTAILDDNAVHWRVPPHSFSFRFWQSVCAEFADLSLTEPVEQHLIWAAYRQNREEKSIPSPDGRYKVRIRHLPILDSCYPADGIGLQSQIELLSTAGKRTVLVPYRPSREPQNDLRWFQGIQWEPDSKGIYFMTDGWATSPAIQYCDLASRTTRFFTDGWLKSILPNSEKPECAIVDKTVWSIETGRQIERWVVSSTGEKLRQLPINE